MKFVRVNGKKIIATKGARALCHDCGSELVAHCGDVYADHWKHKGKRDCDSWSENETEWHRSWKEEFPEDWQEVTLISDSGEKHRADVKTKEGWVIEIQTCRCD